MATFLLSASSWGGRNNHCRTLAGRCPSTLRTTPRTPVMVVRPEPGMQGHSGPEAWSSEFLQACPLSQPAVLCTQQAGWCGRQTPRPGSGQPKRGLQCPRGWAESPTGVDIPNVNQAGRGGCWDRKYFGKQGPTLCGLATFSVGPSVGPGPRGKEEGRRVSRGGGHCAEGS